MTDKEIISSQAQQINLLKEKALFSEEKVIFLLEQLHKSGIKKDSSNSSFAPSTDMFKKNQSLRVKSNLKSGGQFTDGFVNATLLSDRWSAQLKA